MVSYINPGVTPANAGGGGGSGDLLAANNLSDVASATTSATNLGLGTGSSPQFTAINLGHASDTTLTRTGAGAIAVEGTAVLLSGGALGTPSSGTGTNITGILNANVITPQVIAQTDGATITVDASTFGSGSMGIGTVTLAGNRTLTWSNGVAGQRILLVITQDGTGSRTLAYTGATCKFSTDLASPTLTTTAAAVDYQLWICVSSGVFRLLGKTFGF